MLVFVIIAVVIAKINGHDPFVLKRAYPLLAFAAVEMVYITFQIFVSLGYYSILNYSRQLQIAYLLSYLPVIIIYGLYKSAFIGSAAVITGSLLNNLAISVNGGKMPVFATLSKITGYYDETAMLLHDSLHIAGNSETKLKILCDFIDIGFSVMSIGDIMIHSIAFIVIYSTITHLNKTRCSTINPSAKE